MGIEDYKDWVDPGKALGPPPRYRRFRDTRPLGPEAASLVHRVENGRFEDRVLDRLVHYHVATFPQPPYHLELSLADRWDVPRYTSSIDAARALSQWLLLYASDIGGDGLAMVRLGMPEHPPRTVEGYGLGGGLHALARAYCAAAIRTRIIDAETAQPCT